MPKANVWLRSRNAELSALLPAWWVNSEFGSYSDIQHNGRRWRFSHETTMLGADGAREIWVVFEDDGQI